MANTFCLLPRETERAKKKKDGVKEIERERDESDVCHKSLFHSVSATRGRQTHENDCKSVCIDGVSKKKKKNVKGNS